MAGYKKNNSGSRQKYWEKHFEAWQKSGLSQAEYCRRQEISKSTFGYWRNRSLKSSSLVEIPLRLESKSSIILILRDSIRIEISSGFNPELLRQTVTVLEALS